MRKLTLLVAFLLSFALTACDVDTPENIVGDEVVTKLEVTLPETRISLGEKVDGVYSAYWNEGDKIVVNGILSEEVRIDAENKSVATFEVKSGDLEYPFNVTYPYTSATTAETAAVEFKTEQTYTPGSFAAGSAPLCGYAVEIGSKIVLKHLAGVLKLPVKASVEGTILQKIVIRATPGTRISGVFEVNCATATLTPTPHTDYAGDTHNVVTYTLPDNFVLSTSEPSDFFIVLPAGELGSATIEFIEASGKKMVSNWNPSTPIKSGIVREFKPITYVRNTTITLEGELPPYDNVQSRIFKLRAMCYNIHNCTGNDDLYDEQRIADIINAANVEAVAVQEVDSVTTRHPVDIMKNLGAKTGMYPTFGAAIDYKGGKYGVGVLTKQKPISYYTVPLPCSDEPRVLLVVELDNFYYCCTHFSLNAEYRTEAVNIIIEEAKKLNKPMILAGDFNAKRDESSIQTLAEHFEIFEKNGPQNTFPASSPNREIDYICLYKDNGAMAVVSESYVVPETVASDHRPIVIDMAICE